MRRVALWTVERAARFYGARLIDYGPHRGEGVLIASGGGLMLCVMDCAPIMRWCLDIDSDPVRELSSFVEMIAVIARPSALVGWFTATRPERVAAAIARAPAMHVYGGNHAFDHPRECRSLDELLRALDAR